MFFETPGDLMGLDFSRGDCVNASVRQYVGGSDGFGWRNLPGDGGLEGLVNGGVNVVQCGGLVTVVVMLVMGAMSMWGY